MKLILSDAAVVDLQNISAYTNAQWGAEQEERYLRILYRTLRDMADDPSRAKNREDLYPGCHMVASGKHRIFFTIHDEVIGVARILHQAMDFGRHLP